MTVSLICGVNGEDEHSKSSLFRTTKVSKWLDLFSSEKEKSTHSPDSYMTLSRTLAIFAALLLFPPASFAAPSVSTLSPADGANVGAFTSLSVTFNEAVSGVDATDLEINGESAATVSGSGAGAYVFTFTQPAPGPISVAWDFDHGIAGIGTGAFIPPGGYSFTLTDNVAPTVGQIRTLVAGQEMPAIEPQNGATVGVLTQASVTFSEIVSGVDAVDLNINGAAATAVTGSGAGPYVFTFAQPTVGAVTFSWAATPGILDTAGNAFVSPGTAWAVTRAASPGTLVIHEFVAANASGLADENLDASDWIEIFNAGATSVNLVGWSLSNDVDSPGQWVFPSRTIAAGGYLVVFASGKDRKPVSGNLHTNFTLNPNSGDDLFLFAPDSPRGTAVSAFVDYPAQRYNYSYGPQTGGAMRYFATPTPNAANGTSALVASGTKPTASVTRGFFKDPFSIVLSCADPGATIRYTLDGTVPLVGSTAYTTPIAVSNTTILRMAAFSATTVPSDVVTHSYIYLDSVLAQPSPPYDDPANSGDNTNPPLPTISNIPVGSGGVAFPVGWGTRTVTPPFPGGVTNLPANTIPADYGMDPEIYTDPNKYTDAGVVDSVNGKLNSDRIKQGLRDLPILSVVLPNSDMFGAGTGLYVEPLVRQKTPLIEKACSVELLLPDSTTGFATTCGIRIHGNASRDPEKNPKHGFKLNFKGSYGASELGYALFPDSPVREFDDLILRADYNSSWTHPDNGTQRPKGTRLRDAFCKDTFRAMGRIAGHHRYVNLFINGIYWGTYDPTEQENNGFAAAYLGGAKDDYDVYDQSVLKSGTATVYNAMTAIASPIDNPKYEQMKGYLDVPWFIDYMLLHFYLGHQDWGDATNKNWYAVRNNKTNDKFKYLPWDMENLMWDQTVDRTGVASPPSGLHPKLVTNTQYLLDFADRVHKHMVAPDGALTPAAGIARWNKWQSIMTNAIACESARWGDYRRDVHGFNTTGVLYTWNGAWITEVNRLKNTWFPNRGTGTVTATQGVMPQLRTRGLYPMLNAPEFRDNATTAVVGSQRVPAGFLLKMQFPTAAPVNTAGTATTSVGTFYYTTNGADPRVYYDTTGARTPTAVAYSGPIAINSTTTVKARTLNGTTWSALNEQTFTVGFTPQTVKITEIHYNPPVSLGGRSAEFIELQNTGATGVDMSKWSLEGVDFVFPTGFVLGAGDRVVIASNNSPSTFAAQFPGVVVLGYFGSSLDNNGERLTLKDASLSSVFSVDYRNSGPWPIEPDGGGRTLEIIDPNGDSLSPFNWKASDAAKGTPGAANSTLPTPTVRISEFLVKNGGAYTTGGVNPGFVELFNSGPSSVDVTGWKFEGAGVFTIPSGPSIPPGGYLVVHWSPVPLPSPYVIGSLGDSHYLTLSMGNGTFVDGVQYGPLATDYSFSRIGGVWTLSTPTPGSAGIAAATAPQTSLRLNEWLANPTPGFDDWLELANTSATLPVSLTGLWLGGSGELFRIAAPCAVAPGGYVRLFCNKGGDDGNDIGFNLPTSGTTLSLSDGTGTQFDTLTYGTQTEAVPQGRLPNATGPIVTLPFPSPGLANYSTLTNQPMINEILLTNFTGDNAPWGARPSWIELKNPSVSAVNLSGWRLRWPDYADDYYFAFPAGTTIPAGGYLAIWADVLRPSSTVAGPHLNASAAVYGILSGAQLELANSIGQIVDRVKWGRQIPDLSIGRLPDNSWALLVTPTRGAANSAAAALGPVNAVRVNEWRDSIELYNTSALPVPLGGLFLSDDPSEVGRRKYQIAPLSFIAGNGFSVFTANGNLANYNSTGFRVDYPDGEYLRLSQTNDTQIDAVSFGRFTSGTVGRSPDGGASISNTTAPTIGLANSQGTAPTQTYNYGQGAYLAGAPVTLEASFANATTYQWYRNGVLIPGANSVQLIFAAITTGDDATYTNVATGTGGTATSLPIPVTVLHTFDTWTASYGIAGAATDGDADGDGIKNLAEFIANTNPVVAATAAERTAHQAVGALELSAGVPTNMTLDFRLNRRAAFTGLGAEISADLGTWSPTEPTLSELISTESNGDQHWRLKFAVPGATPKRFIRLNIAE